MIKQLSENHPVQAVCQVLEVSRSGYYRRLRRLENRRTLENRELAGQIKRVFVEKRGRYGSPRITEEIRRSGLALNHKRVERLMRQEGLKARSSRPGKPRTTQSNHEQPTAPNLLLKRSAPTRINEVWVCDITYVPTAQGWLFVAAVMDLYSRRILGWSVWESLLAGGALQALHRALLNRHHPRGVIVHSDRGVQYSSREYRHKLQEHGLLASMSRKGNCYDNAAMEAFWSTWKREALQGSQTCSKEQVRRELFEYIEATYNRTRLHSSLAYHSPVDFEHQLN